MPNKKWSLVSLRTEAAQYSSRNAFNKGSRKAYKAAWKMDILNEICQHMTRPQSVIKWTLETLKVEAQRYKTRTEFAKGSSGAYNAAWRNGWLDIVCSHMPKAKRLTDYPRLVEEWHPTKNINLFPENFSKGAHKKVWWQCKRGHEWPAFIYNRTNGTDCPRCSNQSSKNEIRLFSELSGLFRNVLNRYNVLGYEIDIFLKDKKVAIEYDGKFSHEPTQKEEHDLKKQSALVSAGYRFLRVREDPLKKLNDHDIIIPTSSLMTKDQLNKVALWIDDESTIVHAYVNNLGFVAEQTYLEHLENFPAPPKRESLGFLFPDLATEWHFEKNGNLTPFDFRPGSKEVVWWQCQDNFEHVYDAPIGKRSNGSGCRFCANQAASPDNCLATNFPDVAALWHPKKNGDITPEMIVTGSTVKRWWQCSDVLEHTWQDFPRKLTRRLTNDYCPHCNEGWTLEKLVAVAAKFNTRNDFRRGASAAYQAARKRGLLDQICSHMAPSKTGKKWNKAAVALEASKYSHRSDFENGSSGAYDAALKNGWLDEVCWHMSPKPRGKKSLKS